MNCQWLQSVCSGNLLSLYLCLYIILPGKLIRQYGSMVVIGLGMLMGGFVVTLGLQTWKHRLPIDGGSLLGLLGIVGVGDDFRLYSLFEGGQFSWSGKRESIGFD